MTAGLDFNNLATVMFNLRSKICFVINSSSVYNFFQNIKNAKMFSFFNDLLATAVSASYIVVFEPVGIVAKNKIKSRFCFT